MGSFGQIQLRYQYLNNLAKQELLNQGATTFALSTHYAQPQPVVAGENMYYSNGFLSAGANQTTGGGISLGSIIGGALSGLESVFHFPTSAPSVPTGEPGGITGQVPATNQHPILTGAGGASGKGTAGKVAAGTAIVGGLAGVLAPGLVGLGGHKARYAPAGTKGYHMIKKGPHAGMWTRNRHRNVANIRALRRALSRAHGFERICRKVVHFVSPHKKGRAVFRRRRRK